MAVLDVLIGLIFDAKNVHYSFFQGFRIFAKVLRDQEEKQKQ